MKRLIALLMITATPSFADGVVLQARVTSVQPIYVERYVDTYEPRCQNVEVPIYGTVQGGSSSDALAGALIGGALGNQFGEGKGKDAMTVLGAIIGADAASKTRRQVITGYRTERQCQDVLVQKRVSEVSKYRVEYEFGGNKYSQETRTEYRVGQRVNVNVSLR